jgi:hypothetical protein
VLYLLETDNFVLLQALQRQRHTFCRVISVFD